MDDNKEREQWSIFAPQSTIERVFTEWERRRRANPDDFQTDAEVDQQSPETYGTQAAQYFKSILKDIIK